MRKEEVKNYTGKEPFKIITNSGFIATVKSLLEFRNSDIVFYDKFGGLCTCTYDSIGMIQELKGLPKDGDINGK